MLNSEKVIISFLWLIVSYYSASSQNLNYFEHIRPIIYENCVPCHQPGQAGPFSLLTYDDITIRSKMIQYVVSHRYMPPWKADPDYRHYLNERVLTDAEIDLITEWISTGMSEGNKTKESLPVKRLYYKTVPDLTLTMAESYDIPNSNTDDFRFFHLPMDISELRYLRAIEFMPGNRRYVHHSRMMVDSTKNMSGIDGMSEFDPKVSEFQKTPLADEFLYGWVPGSFPLFFPDGVGKRLEPNADLILNIHYSPTGRNQKDQSAVNFYFTNKPVKREVKTLILRENDIINQPFYLPANQISNFTMKSEVLKKDISMISVMPHMHFLGKYFESYAVTVKRDTIPLIRINDWDFNWQTMYQFTHYLKIPEGSVIYAKARYDNTINNPMNQFIPPKNIGYGWHTVSEMMNLICYYVDYKKRDERHYFSTEID